MSGTKSRAGDWCRRRWRTARASLEDAIRGPGEARDGMLLQAKGAAAATVAWCLSSWLLPANVTAFAPFTALLALQATVYRSMWDSAQYLGAMAIGTAVAAAFGSTVGVHAWALCVLVFVALMVARLHLLGGQDAQVPVVALFAFAGGGGRIDYIGPSSRPPPSASAAASPPTSPSPLAAHGHGTAPGRGTGRPRADAPARPGPDRRGEEAGRGGTGGGLAAPLRGPGGPGGGRARDARKGAGEHQAESPPLLERRPGLAPALPRDHRHDRARRHARPLHRPRPDVRAPDPRTLRAAPLFEVSVSADFSASYAELLYAIAEALEHLAPPRGPDDPDRLRARVEDAERRYEEVTTATRSGRPDREGVAVHGTVLVEAARILEEIKHTADLAADTRG